MKRLDQITTLTGCCKDSSTHGEKDVFSRCNTCKKEVSYCCATPLEEVEEKVEEPTREGEEPKKIRVVKCTYCGDVMNVKDNIIY